MSMIIQREVDAVEIREGKAYLPFEIDDLYWLYDKMPERDGYRDVLWNLIKKLEDEKNGQPSS